jgi:hypothetical protein
VGKSRTYFTFFSFSFANRSGVLFPEEGRDRVGCCVHKGGAVVHKGGAVWSTRRGNDGRKAVHSSFKGLIPLFFAYLCQSGVEFVYSGTRRGDPKGGEMEENGGGMIDDGTKKPPWISPKGLQGEDSKLSRSTGTRFAFIHSYHIVLFKPLEEFFGIRSSIS